MSGLLLLVLVAGYVWLVYRIIQRVPRWAKPLVVIIAFLALTADDYLGRKKLEKMCEEQGGLHIYRTVEGVEGFNLGLWKPTPYWIKDKGYIFIEGHYFSETVERLSISDNGEIKKENEVKPKSKYTIRDYTKNDTPQRYYTTWRTVILNQHNDILAETVIIGYEGGWTSRFIAKLYASKSIVKLCSPMLDTDVESLDFWKANVIPKVLKPKNQEK